MTHSSSDRKILLFLGFALLAFPQIANGHEKWLLSAKQVAELNSQPRPEIFTHLNSTNVSMFAFTCLFVAGWISLKYMSAREWFPDLQAWLASHGDYASLGLRIALSILLATAGSGLAPRVGTARFEAPTLAAPDLELRLLGPGWEWIGWVEVALAFCLLLGVYVRVAAAAVLGVGVLGLCLFGYDMLDYIGLIGGAAVYLLFQGAGSYFLPMRPIPGTANIVAWFAAQPRARAQRLLQILAGFNLAYLAVAYKFAQPNLMLAIIREHGIPTFGIDRPTFVLWMALIEGFSGLLIIAGILMRFLSVLLFLFFAFFSAILGEGVLGHIIFYGLLVSFITNGDGRWRCAVPQDKSQEIGLTALIPTHKSATKRHLMVHKQ